MLVLCAAAQLRAMVSAVLAWQAGRYDHLKAQPAAAAFLSSPKFIAELLPFYEQEHYRLSLAVEPRETPPNSASGSGSGAGTPALGPASSSSPIPISAGTGSLRGGFWRGAGLASSPKPTDDSAGGSRGRADTGGSARTASSGGGSVSGSGAPAAPEPGRRMVSLLDDSEMEPERGVGGLASGSVGHGIGGAGSSGGIVPTVRVSLAPPSEPGLRPISAVHSTSQTPITAAGSSGDSGSDGEGSDPEDAFHALHHHSSSGASGAVVAASLRYTAVCVCASVCATLA
jgi:hypothetical protein